MTSTPRRVVRRSALLALLAMLALPTASQAVFPHDGETFPLKEVHSRVVGHLSGMLAGPFDGPCKAADPRPVSDPNADYDPRFHYTEDRIETDFSILLSGDGATVSPEYGCRPGFYNGSSKNPQPIYAFEAGKYIASTYHFHNVTSCCSDIPKVADNQTAEEKAESYTDLVDTHFTVVNAEPAKRFTDAEKQAFSKKSAELNIEAGTAGGVVAVCAVSPDPFTKACALLGGIEIAILGIGSGYYSGLAADPVDKNYRKVAKPVKLSLPSASSTGLPAAIVTAIDRLAADAAKEAGLGPAIDTAINRSQGAYGNDPAAEKKQLDAARGYARQLADLLDRADADKAKVVAAFRAAGYPDITATPDDARRAQHDNFVPGDDTGTSDNPGPGPSAEQRGILNALSSTPAILRQATSVMVAGQLPTAPATLYGILAPSKTTPAAKKALRSFAKRPPKLSRKKKRKG